jgi:hypothetical protein
MAMVRRRRRGLGEEILLGLENSVSLSFGEVFGGIIVFMCGEARGNGLCERDEGDDYGGWVGVDDMWCNHQHR